MLLYLTDTIHEITQNHTNDLSSQFVSFRGSRLDLIRVYPRKSAAKGSQESIPASGYRLTLQCRRERSTLSESPASGERR